MIDSVGHKGQDVLVLERHHSALPEVMAEVSQSILISVHPTDSETRQHSSVWEGGCLETRGWRIPARATVSDGRCG